MAIAKMVEDTQTYEIIADTKGVNHKLVKVLCSIGSNGSITLKTLHQDEEFKFIKSSPEMIESLIGCFGEAVLLGRAKREKTVKVDAES
jgi:hypothetical protein